MEKKQLIILYSVLALILFFGFFLGLGSYPLLDIDETRYVTMARDMFNSGNYLTLYLNGDFFFEKPPLYFWLECLSFHLTGVVSELTARLPIVLLSLFPAGFMIFLTRKVKDDKFAVITLATLFSSIEYIFMTKIAILDSVLTSFVVSSVLCYFCTFFVENKNKKYFWILTYIFSGLAVMAKGIPGVAIPMLVIAISTVIFKTYKETLKYSWGILLFLAVILPWHIIMLKMYPHTFFHEYIYKHHILRFLGSSVIDRNEPWYFYLVTLLWGLCPHIFVLFSQVTKIKDIKFNLKEDYSKLLTLNLVAILSILVFFSASGAKLITYILPIYPFMAILLGAIWLKYIDNDDKAVRGAVILITSILTLALFVMCFIKYLVPLNIYGSFKPIQIFSIVCLVPYVICSWIFIAKGERMKQFLTLALFMAAFSGLVTPAIYKFDYSFGQDELIRYAQIAKDNNYTISAYMTGKRYSLLYYGNKTKIDFKTKEDINWLNKELDKKNNIVIVKNKKVKSLMQTNPAVRYSRVSVAGAQLPLKYSIIERVKR